MTTFSQIIDSMVSETKRPDLRVEIADYTNLTIRELHFDPGRGGAICYRENRKELRLTADSDTGFMWTIANPAIFQMMEAVRLTSVTDRQGKDVWSQERSPGRNLQGQMRFHYRVGRVFVFSDYGGTDSLIDLSYFEFPKRLKYYASGARPATWDDSDGFTYYDLTPDGLDYTDLDNNEAGENLVTNWILLRWNDVVAEGVRAKIYKRVADEVRAKTSYSMYSSLRQGLFSSEVAISEST